MSGFDLVTGACGFTGAHLVKRLLSEGRSVIATDLPRAFEHPKNKKIFSLIGLDMTHSNCTVRPADLTDAEAVARLFDGVAVERVFHTASLYDYSAPIELLRRINVEGARNLFEAAGGHAPLRRFIHWSTCGVFGKPHPASEGLRRNTPFTEDSSSPRNTPFGQKAPSGTHLVNDYSISKWEQEHLAWRYHRERGLPLTVVRPAPVYGPGSDYGHGGIILAVRAGLVPVIPADARHYVTTSVHVEDIVGFAVHIAGIDAAVGDDFNVVDDSIVSFAEFLEYIALLLGRRMWRAPFVFMPALRWIAMAAARIWTRLEKRWGVPRVRVLEIGSATYMASSYWIANNKSKAAGYRYRYPDVREGLRDTIAWFARAGWLAPGYQPKGIWAETI